MFKNGKWHQFTKVKANDNLDNHHSDTDKTNYLDSYESNIRTLQKIKNSEPIKTVDSSTDKQNNYEQKTPTLKLTQNNTRPKLDVTKVLKHKNRLSY